MIKKTLRTSLAVGCVLAAMTTTAGAQGAGSGGGEAAENAEAQSNTKKSKKHLARAEAHYKAGRFSKAAGEYRAAYELVVTPATLFAWAQAERLAGDCNAALDLYDRFLSTNPSDRHEAAARNVMKLCTRTTEDAAEPVEPEKPRPVVASSAVSDDGNPRSSDSNVGNGHTERTSDAWYLDPIGDSLLVGGLVALGVGVGYWLRSSATLERDSHDEQLARFGSAESQRTVAIVAGSLGATLTAAAIARYLTRPSDDDSINISAMVDPSGASLWLRTSF